MVQILRGPSLPGGLEGGEMARTMREETGSLEAGFRVEEEKGVGRVLEKRE